MKKIIGLVLLAMWIVSAGCSQKEIGVAKFSAGQVQHVIIANKIKWRSCPPSLPKNCEMTVLEGHPKKADMFTIRFKTTGAIFMPAHTHPKDERVTIIKGKAAVAFGVNAKRENGKEFSQGGYYINARNEVHKVWIEKDTILQITGIGPWEANFIK